MKALEELQRQKIAFDKKFENDGREALEAGFADFFAIHAGVASVRWTQFTADSDCQEVDEPVFKLMVAESADAEEEEEEEEEENEEEEEEGGEEEDDEESDGFVDANDIADPSIRRACKTLAAQITGYDDLFLMLFGESSEVTVTRDGFEVTEIELSDEDEE